MPEKRLDGIRAEGKNRISGIRVHVERDAGKVEPARKRLDQFTELFPLGLPERSSRNDRNEAFARARRLAQAERAQRPVGRFRCSRERSSEKEARRIAGRFMHPSGRLRTVLRRHHAVRARAVVAEAAGKAALRRAFERRIENRLVAEPPPRAFRLRRRAFEQTGAKKPGLFQRNFEEEAALQRELGFVGEACCGAAAAGSGKGAARRVAVGRRRQEADFAGKPLPAARFRRLPKAVDDVAGERPGEQHRETVDFSRARARRR